MSNAFSWNDSDVVFHTSQGVAVYRCEDGDIVIRQERSILDDDDPMIRIPLIHAEAVLNALCRVVEEAEVRA